MSELTHTSQPITARNVSGHATPMENGNTGASGLPRCDIAEASDDRVIRSISSALEAAEQGRDRYCIEALRLAISARLARLQSYARKADPPGEAESNGRRIRPLQKWRLTRVEEYVQNHLADKIRLSELAAVAGLSRMHFASQFRMATGLRPHDFLLRRRVQRAEELLRGNSIAIVEIALTVGFQTQAHFTTVFKRFVGDTPYQWRNAHCASGRRAK
jgi:AraC family transcriptional regulator